jgi:ketosteroid isomerase-like protein
MNYRSLLATAVLLVPVLIPVIALTHTQIADQSRTERYIKESEGAWAEAGSKGDTATIERILSDDFAGVAPDGSFYDKAKEIANTHQEQGNVLSNHTNEIKVRFFGKDTAVAQGSETWETRAGDPKRGTYVWTDTWILRNGKWQIVAAEDVVRTAVSAK